MEDYKMRVIEEYKELKGKYTSEVYETNPLAWLLHMADEEAAFIQKV